MNYGDLTKAEIALKTIWKEDGTNNPTVIDYVLKELGLEETQVEMMSQQRNKKNLPKQSKRLQFLKSTKTKSKKQLRSYQSRSKLNIQKMLMSFPMNKMSFYMLTFSLIQFQSDTRSDQILLNLLTLYIVKSIILQYVSL